MNIKSKKAPHGAFLLCGKPPLNQVRQEAGTYLSAIEPATAALFALVLPVDLQIQVMEPPVGTVLAVEVAVSAAPLVTLPSTGDRIRVLFEPTTEDA